MLAQVSLTVYGVQVIQELQARQVKEDLSAVAWQLVMILIQ